MNIEIYQRPQEGPPILVDEGKNIRIFYNNQWVDFRDGKIIVRENEPGPE
jgi:hypothetical protein